ncbi:aminotransferase class I/II-fold pyridoxal phosphate-dependent enzyme [Diplocloster hominis]|uniref:aminotransferase class I/II-fold pyridoxal phosphate-dependent enzyme n=1 Tax=Diplocloster hominis TaxID=3079010 RepID=UPI0031BA9116
MMNSDLYTRLKDYGGSDFYGFHMPGHKRQMLYPFENPMGIDITEIDGFDNLHHAEGILKEAQGRAAQLYGSSETHFLVNGSTAGLLSAISGCTARGGKIIMARNCHKAVYHAAFLNELEVIYWMPGIDPVYGVNCGLPVDNLKKLLEENPETQAVVMTSPTYDGVVSNVDKVVEIVHKCGIPLIVDEAHGAHFGFDRRFPGNSVGKGADVVIHSLHKTLPSMTQTALIHLNGVFADREKIRRYLAIYQTSSPSYVLMSSIDSCISLLAQKREELFDSFYHKLSAVRDQLGDMKKLHLYTKEDAMKRGGEDLDPSKLLITTAGTNLNGKELSSLLRERYHLEMEMEAPGYVLALTSIADTKEGFQRLVQALMEIDRQCEEERKYRCVEDVRNTSDEFPCVNETAMSIWQAERYRKKSVPLMESSGHVSGEFVYKYPPGIPLIAPGEVISNEVLELVSLAKKQGINVQGMKDFTAESIEILEGIRP